MNLSIKAHSGCTRLVLLVGTLAIKIPNFTYSWNHFLMGLVHNMRERQVWHYNGFDPQRKQLRDKLLCPVLWASWGGWLVIMVRADVTTHQQQIRLVPEEEDYKDFLTDLYSDWIAADFGGDDKPDNYGLLNGKLVKVDYGQS